MKKKFKDFCLSFDLMLFFIISAILLTVFVSDYLHAFDTMKYQLDKYVGLSSDVIKDNYHLLTQYLWIWHREPLELYNFCMSEGGKIHFAEVKRIFDILQIIWVVTLVYGIFGVISRFKKKEITFLRDAAFLMIFVPATIGLLAMSNFDAAFIFFHHLLFNNDYWIFDYQLDPVINILPEAFFMHCFILIVIFALAFAFALYGYYRYRLYKELKNI